MDQGELLPGEVATLKVLGGTLDNLANNANTFGIEIKIPQDYDFIIDDPRAVVLLNAVTGGALAGTPLLEDPSPTVGSNTMYSAWKFNIGLNIKSENIIEAPQPLPAVFGKARQAAGLLVGIRVPAGTTIKFPLENYTGVAVDTKITLIGRKVVKAAK